VELIFYDDPFPHIAAQDCLSPSQLELIWYEIQFLSSPAKLHRPGIDHGAYGLDGLTSSRAAILERIYARPEVSDIICTMTELTFMLGRKAAEHWPEFVGAGNIERLTTKLRYYHDGDEYATHTDSSKEYLMFFYLHKEPKAFTGGELFFEPHSYIFPAHSNTAIFMAANTPHGVNRVSIPENDYWAGNGRYALTQFVNGIHLPL
jgi:hypothetical protein